ncbi:Uncharacterised protein [Prevotella intermedia]|nr:Uncharacterised protein [Prevotella intermedia]
MQFASIYNNTLPYFHNSPIKVFGFCCNAFALTYNRRVFTFKASPYKRRNSVKTAYFIDKKNFIKV